MCACKHKSKGTGYTTPEQGGRGYHRQSAALATSPLGESSRRKPARHSACTPDLTFHRRCCLHLSRLWPQAGQPRQRRAVWQRRKRDSARAARLPRACVGLPRNARRSSSCFAGRGPQAEGVWVARRARGGGRLPCQRRWGALRRRRRRAVASCLRATIGGFVGGLLCGGQAPHEAGAENLVDDAAPRRVRRRMSAGLQHRLGRQGKQGGG